MNEVPIWPVPDEMTLEEYTDANRRLSVGLALAAIPIPGTLHFYAGEKRAGWMHVGAAVLGGSAILLGASIIDEKTSWKKTDYEIIDIIGDSGTLQRYAKIPLEEEAGNVNYRLKKLDRKTADGAGSALLVLGVGLIIGEIVHDMIGGIKTIERKRDAVRYKYGKLASVKLSMHPEMNIGHGRVGAHLTLDF